MLAARIPKSVYTGHQARVTIKTYGHTKTRYSKNIEVTLLPKNSDRKTTRYNARRRTVENQAEVIAGPLFSQLQLHGVTAPPCVGLTGWKSWRTSAQE